MTNARIQPDPEPNSIIETNPQFWATNLENQARLDGKGFVVMTSRQFTQPINPHIYAQRGFLYRVPDPNDTGFTQPDPEQYPRPQARPALIFPADRDTEAAADYAVRPGLVFAEPVWPMVLRWSMRSVATVIWNVTVYVERENDLLTSTTIPVATSQESVGNPAPWSLSYTRFRLSLPELRGGDGVEVVLTRLGSSSADTALDSAAAFDLSGVLE